MYILIYWKNTNNSQTMKTKVEIIEIHVKQAFKFCDKSSFFDEIIIERKATLKTIQT